MKEKIEIVFQEWEKKLPWVIKYNNLMNKDNLTLEDCAELPKMRNKAIELHKARENLLPKAIVKDETPKPVFRKTEVADPISEKFQNAVDNLVAKFCEPREEEYSLFLKQLTAETAQRDDASKFTDDLKTRHVEAATLRFLLKTDVTYNPRIIKFRAIGLMTPEKAAEDFDIASERFKQRYITDVLNKDKSILQSRVVELKDEEAKAQESFTKNKNAITETDLEITKLAQPVKQDIATKKATLVPHQANPQVKPLNGIRPPPPQIAKVLMKAAPKKAAQEDKVMTTKQAGGFSAQDLLGIKLKKRQVKIEEPKPAQPESQKDLATTFGSMFGSNLPQEPRTAKVTTPKKEKTIAEIEESLEVLALAIKTNEQNVTRMKECVEKQNAYIRIQKKQLVELNAKNWKVEVNGEPVKTAVASDSEPMKRNTSIKPPPPPMGIPKPPINVATKKVHAKAEQPVVVTPASTPPAWQADLFSKLSQMRGNMRPGEDDWDEESDDSDAKEKQEAENRKRVEEQKKRQVILKKYDDVVQSKFDPEASVTDGSNKIVAMELNRLEMKNTQPLIVTELEDAIKELKRLEEAKAAMVEKPKLVTPQVETPEVPKSEIPKSIIPDEAPKSELPKSATPDEAPKSELPKSATSDEGASLENKFKDACSMDEILGKKVANRELSNDVKKDVLALKTFVDKKLAEMDTKDIDACDKPHYRESLESFYREALTIRLSGLALPRQKVRFEELAHRSFDSRHVGRRLLADALMVISSFVGIGILIGVGRVLSGRTYFFSHAPTERESDFKNKLLDDQSANNLFV